VILGVYFGSGAGRPPGGQKMNQVGKVPTPGGAPEHSQPAEKSQKRERVRRGAKGGERKNYFLNSSFKFA
jgi:hypothetical protein